MNNSEFDFGQSQGQKLAFAFRRAGEGNELLEWLSTGDNLKKIGSLSRGEAELVLKDKPEVNTLIRVDRSLKPKYPESWGEPAHPELEGIGPSEYDMSRVVPWLHDDQMDGGYAKGHKIYEYLSSHNLLKDCLGYDDALMIQRINPISFRRLLGLNAILCWRSVIRNVNGNLSVPALYDLSGEIKLSLFWLSENFNNLYPAGRYPK